MVYIAIRVVLGAYWGHIHFFFFVTIHHDSAHSSLITTEVHRTFRSDSRIVVSSPMLQPGYTITKLLLGILNMLKLHSNSLAILSIVFMSNPIDFNQNANRVLLLVPCLHYRCRVNEFNL